MKKGLSSVAIHNLMSDNTSRTRTVSWHDPQVYLENLQTMDGITFLRSIVEGKMPTPPIGILLDFSLEQIEPGRAVFIVKPAEQHYNPIGAVQGGLAAAVLDAAMGCAIQSTLPAGVGYTTVELHLNYIRPITNDTGPLTGIGKIIHSGRRIATAEGHLTDTSGKLYAHSTTTCMIFQP